MKVTFVGHAVLLIETGSVKILCDPWWIGPCFGVQWWQWPRPQLAAVEGLAPDFIYVSHGHSDHLHLGTLRRLPRSARVIVSVQSGIAETVERLGFDVIRAASGMPLQLSPEVTAELIDAIAGDTMLVVGDRSEVLVNANDALHAAPVRVQDRLVAQLAARYPAIDYLFLGYGTASSFPNCHFVSGKDNLASAARRQAYFNAVWSSLVARIAPRFAFPFAANAVLLDEALMWSNEPVHNAERPTERFRRDHPASPVRVCDIAPGFAIEDGRVTHEILFQPLALDRLRREMAAQIRTANAAVEPGEAQIYALAGHIEENIARCHPYLAECDHNYRVLIKMKRAKTGIEIRKIGNKILLSTTDEPTDPARYDAVFETRFSYLRRAVTTPFGYELLTVGSGGVWRYRSRETAWRNLHREILPLIRQTERPPASRFGDQPRWLHRVKTAVKRAMTAGAPDLYDLREWTVLEKPHRP
jgi:Beta-lactamase superfamily domain